LIAEEVFENEKARNCLMGMGQTSENVAEKYNISREVQDRFAAESQRRAYEAQTKGLFKDEIVPIKTSIKKKKGDEEISHQYPFTQDIDSPHLIMTTKEINVDELLNSHTEGRTKTNKDSKKNKNDDDWDETEDTNGLGGFAVVQSKSSKAKAKKKTETQGWGAATETKPVAPVVEKIEQPQEPAPKKGIFKKITGDTATVKPKVDLQEELFPTLGEEAPKNVPKKKVEAVSPVKTESQSAQSSGPRRFVNAAKKGAGEHFVPLDPTLTEKALPVIEKPVVAEKTEKTEKIERIERTERTEKTEEKKPEEKEKPTEYKDIAPKGFFSRNTKTTTELEANAAAAEASEETKFKFGGEGPKKFSAGNKISFKREEEKSELEDIRLQKEREIEEKLQKEREEAAKAREQRDIGRKPREHKEGEKPHHENKEGEEKRPAKFANSKKDGEKAPRKISNDKTAPKEPVEEPKIVPAKEVIEIHGSLSTKGWDEDGGIKKKATAVTAAKK
jgi:hypothetical protein